LEDGEHALALYLSGCSRRRRGTVYGTTDVVPFPIPRFPSLRFLILTFPIEGADERVRRYVGSEIHYLFGQGEDARFAGDYQEAMGGIATEPARPLQAARIDGTIQAVPGERIGDEAG
jgi:hypothetical protein